MEATITRAALADAEDILALQKLAFLTEAERYNDFDIPPLTQTLDEIRAQFADHVFLKAVLGGRIVGSVRAGERDGQCHVGRLIVHPDFRRRGIATRLMHEIEACFPNARSFSLFTGAASDGNLSLYARLGYSAVPGAEPDTRVALVRLEKPNARASRAGC